MAEDKIYISRMLNDLIGSVGGMSTSMMQLSTAMAAMQTEIASSVTELNKITQNTASLLTEIVVEPGATNGTAKYSCPNNSNSFNTSGETGKSVFAYSGNKIKVLASGVIRLASGKIETVDTPVELNNIIGINENGVTAGVCFNGKSWSIALGARVGEKIYHSIANTGTSSAMKVDIPVNAQDVVELGIVAELRTTSESASTIHFKVPKKWFGVYFNQVHITTSNAVMKIEGN